MKTKKTRFSAPDLSFQPKGVPLCMSILAAHMPDGLPKCLNIVLVIILQEHAKKTN